MSLPRNRDPLRALRLLGLLSVAVPLFIYALFAAYRFVDANDDGEQRVSRSLRVAHEHAVRVVGEAEALQDRLHDLVRGRSLGELRASEPALHAVLAAKVKDQPHLQSIWILGADGRAIASSRFMPVPQNVVFTDRAYFRFHQQGRGGRFLSEPLTSRTTGERIVDISLRFDGPDGAFGGVINISVYTDYFLRFYSDLVADEPGLAVNLFNRDGAIYTRWPVIPNAPQRLAASSPVMASVAAGQASAQTRGISSVDQQERLIAYRQIGSYPLFVGTGMNISTLRNELLRELALMFALASIPLAVLLLTARLALTRTRESLETAQRLESEADMRRRAEAALLQAQKLEALGRLTGGVAHDFNNALMVMSNNAYLLRRNVAAEGLARLESIERAVTSATKLTRQLLAFSRRQALVPEVVQLQSQLPAIRELIGPVLGGQIQLAVEVAPDTAAVRLDVAELELALLNLAINARDAMPGGGALTITARNAGETKPAEVMGDAVLIEVGDTGSGIAPDALDKVFEPFFTTKPVGEGTGLGLSQVYGFCRRAGGSAAIASTLGKGTRVTLYFPAVREAAPDRVDAAPTAERQHDKQVLLVEDNEDVAHGMAAVLESLGCRVHRTEGAQAALDWLNAAARMPDLVLSDVVMPGAMDGLALARELRRTRPALPVILMTGYAAQLEAIEKEGFTILPKPCSAQALSAAIARIGADS